MIRADSLGHTFASGRAGLVSVDLQVAAGELVVLLGPNGSGKTTLLRLLAGDLAPTAGSLSVDLGPLTGALAKSAIGFAPAQPVHFNELTGRENAEFFAAAYGASDAAVRHHLAILGLTADAGTRVREYSFGMRRKLLLIEALAHEPALLLLDEPSIGLDPPALVALAATLNDRIRSGAAVVVGTNDVRMALPATRVVFLHHGRKVADAPPHELLRTVDSTLRIQVSLASLPAGAVEFPESVTATALAEGFCVAARDSAVLPEVCAAILRAGARIGAVHIREPDLADVFLKLTGDTLKTGQDLVAGATDA